MNITIKKIHTHRKIIPVTVENTWNEFIIY